MSKKRKKKIRIPKSVSDLKLSPKKFAKKYGIRLKGKGMSKSEKKRNLKRLKDAYSRAAITGLNKAVKILSENPQEEGKKITKIKSAVDNVVTNSSVMKKVAKLYRKNPDNYTNMIFLPHMIVNTLLYYSQEGISEEEKEISLSLDKEGLIEFCQKILKSKIKRYKKHSFSSDTSFKLAEVIPTTKLLVNNRQWYKKLIQSLYIISETEDIDFQLVLRAVLSLDKKKKYISKNEFYERFYSEFILTKSSNKNHSFTDTQKELHESLIEKTLEYLEDLKSSKLREILKTYIKRRKTAESYKNDTRRVIKFIDYANSNSSFTKIKSVIQELIADNSTNELYLS